jgi:hypothetical protein
VTTNLKTAQVKLPLVDAFIITLTHPRLVRRRLAAAALWAFFLFFAPVAASCQLAVSSEWGSPPVLTFKGEPTIAYGPSPQHILTYLPRGNGEDYTAWLDWAIRYGYGNVRSYPPSIIVESPAINLFEFAPGNTGKVDLNKFNDAYFHELRKACRQFERFGIIVHLQLWQAVHWKKKWEENYYNPRNNINPDISRHAGPQEFSTTANPLLLKHQIAYVNRIIDATANLGNVFYDIMNEIGNGTAANREWVDAIITSIRQKEKDNGIRVLLTLNDEGGRRMGDASLNHPQLDLIIKDSGRYDEHVKTSQQFGKPTISVRNIDFNFAKKRRLYFFGPNNLEINSDAELQIRGRKYWWRMYMAGAAAAAGYADSISTAETSLMHRLTATIYAFFGRLEMQTVPREASYRSNTLAENQFRHFKTFIDKVGHSAGLRPVAGVLSDHPVANSYCLQNGQRAIIYLESPNGEAGYSYPPRSAKLEGLNLCDGEFTMLVYHPGTGDQSTVRMDVHKGRASIQLPEFKDDLALLIQ